MIQKVFPNDESHAAGSCGEFMDPTNANNHNASRLVPCAVLSVCTDVS